MKMKLLERVLCVHVCLATDERQCTRYKRRRLELSVVCCSYWYNLDKNLLLFCLVCRLNYIHLETCHFLLLLLTVWTLSWNHYSVITCAGLYIIPQCRAVMLVLFPICIPRGIWSDRARVTLRWLTYVFLFWSASHVVHDALLTSQKLHGCVCWYECAVVSDGHWWHPCIALWLVLVTVNMPVLHAYEIACPYTHILIQLCPTEWHWSAALAPKCAGIGNTSLDAPCGLWGFKNSAHSVSWPEVIKCVPNQGVDCFVS